MTTYRGIKGLGIQNITSDAASSQVGGGTWTSGTAMNTARLSGVGAGVSKTSAIMASGYTGTGPGATANTETYNGSAWTETGDLARLFFYSNGFGTTTAMIVAGKDGPPGPGNDKPAATESFDGTSWSSPGADINNNRFFGGCCGVSTAGIVFGGQAPGATNYVETWDGSSWTETTEINTAKQKVNSGTGTQTAALSAGGTPSTTEEWNGSSWTEIGDPNTGRNYASKSGIVTAALMFGGEPNTAKTEYWDGTSWTEVGDLGTARAYAGPAGSGQPGANANSLAFGGQSTTIIGNTEEWNAPAVFRQLNVGDIYYNADPSSGVLKYTGYSQPTGTWASGGNMNTARSEFIGSNIAKTSHAIAAGGPATIVEQYDGTSWTEIADVNTSRTNGAGMGRSPNACLLAGGQSDRDETEEFDGSSWTELADINTARRNAGQAGTTTAGLIFGGNTPPANANAESWNGSAWSEVGDLNTARGETDGNGISTSAICVGGEPNTQHVEEWNGSSWSEVAEINVGTEVSVTAGANAEDALNYSGGPPRPTTTEYWNGSSWTETGDLSVGVQAATGGGTHSSEAWLAGGYGGSPAGNVATTQEWSAGAGLKTLASTNA